MYDYQKQLAEKQKEISSIEKQLAAYQGDTSEEGASKRQQLQNDLKMCIRDRLTDVAYNSEGTAQKKFEDNYLNSLEAKTNQLKSSLEGLSTSLISDDMYAGFLDGSKACLLYTSNIF